MKQGKWQKGAFSCPSLIEQREDEFTVKIPPLTLALSPHWVERGIFNCGDDRTYEHARVGSSIAQVSKGNHNNSGTCFGITNCKFNGLQAGSGMGAASKEAKADTCYSSHAGMT